MVSLAGSIVGQVVRSDGGSAAGRILEVFPLQSASKTNFRKSTVSSGGGFRFDRLSPGEYLVRVRTPGDDPLRLACLPRIGVVVEEGRTTRLAPFRLDQGGRIAGRVRNGDDGIGLGGMHILATLLESNPAQSGPVADTQSDRAGAFSVCLPVGHYRITGMYYGGDAFLAMRSRTDVNPDTVTVTPGSNTTLQIVYTQTMAAGGRSLPR